MGMSFDATDPTAMQTGLVRQGCLPASHLPGPSGGVVVLWARDLEPPLNEDAGRSASAGGQIESVVNRHPC